MIWDEDLEFGLGLEIRIGIAIWDEDGEFENLLGLKLIYRLKIIFELEVYLIGCGVAGVVSQYCQLNLTGRMENYQQFGDAIKIKRDISEHCFIVFSAFPYRLLMV